MSNFTPRQFSAACLPRLVRVSPCPSVSVRVSASPRQSAITSPSAPGPCPSVSVRVSPCVRAPQEAPHE